MADGIYVGMAAAAARAEQLDSIADNLANVETPGFKASHPAFQSFLPRGASATSDKVATAAVSTGVNTARGTVVTTQNPLDIIPQDDAFLTVRTSTGPAYTRNGRLTLSGDGFLTSDGRLVIGPPAIPSRCRPALSPSSTNGAGWWWSRWRWTGWRSSTWKAAWPTSAPRCTGPASVAPPFRRPNLGVNVGQLEMGNSTPLDATVQMIGAQRQFEMAMQAIQTYRRLDDRVIEVGKSR